MEDKTEMSFEFVVARLGEIFQDNYIFDDTPQIRKSLEESLQKLLLNSTKVRWTDNGELIATVCFSMSASEAQELRETGSVTISHRQIFKD